MTTVSVSRQLTQRVNDAFQTHCRQTQPDIITSISIPGFHSVNIIYE